MPKNRAAGKFFPFCPLNIEKKNRVLAFSWLRPCTAGTYTVLDIYFSWYRTFEVSFVAIFRSSSFDISYWSFVVKIGLENIVLLEFWSLQKRPEPFRDFELQYFGSARLVWKKNAYRCNVKWRKNWACKRCRLSCTCPELASAGPRNPSLSWL